MTALTAFAKGQRVRYTGHHPRHQVHGLTAHVVGVVKSRGVVTIDFDQRQGWCGYFDARPESLEPLTTQEKPQ